MADSSEYSWLYDEPKDDFQPVAFATEHNIFLNLLNWAFRKCERKKEGDSRPRAKFKAERTAEMIERNS